MVQNYGIVIHGGAGTISRKTGLKERESVLKESVSGGYEILRKGGASIDAVEEAIRVMEDSKVFNAGSGSCVTIEGKVETDAAVMKGDLSCGAVAHASVVKNPISLARAVMEKSDHVLISGADELERFARAIDFPLHKLKPTEKRLKQYKIDLARIRNGKSKEWRLNSKLESYFGTVGAVAIDSRGILCSGVSTGGRSMKLPGRVGDSAVIGAGIYAYKNSGAACATGEGEEIIRVCLSKTVCDFMEKGLGAQRAADAAIGVLTERRGTNIAGIIVIDKQGGLGISRNTRMMPHSYLFSNMRKAVTNGF